MPAMRSSVAALVLLAACGNDIGMPGEVDEQFDGTQSYAFGPFDIAPGQEISSDCVQITLGNEDYANVNVVELTTGPGFHHSNWFYVPEFTFPGEDGRYRCSDRGFDQAIAAIKGGVFFAQSTQNPHEVQQFPEGVVVRIPPHYKLVAQLHLLNAGEEPLHLTPTIDVTYLKDADVTTRLAGMSFQNAALALPSNMSSRFSVECDLTERHTALLGRLPDFKLYYALAHYHDLGTGLTIEAVKASGDKTTVFTTTTQVGDVMGGPLAPAFDFTGYAKIRMTCDYYNNRGNVVGWGIGDQEMCVFLAFTDSTYNFGGGVLDEDPPQNQMMVGNTMTYENPCVVFANDADRG